MDSPVGLCADSAEDRATDANKGICPRLAGIASATSSSGQSSSIRGPPRYVNCRLSTYSLTTDVHQFHLHLHPSSLHRFPQLRFPLVCQMHTPSFINLFTDNQCSPVPPLSTTEMTAPQSESIVPLPAPPTVPPPILPAVVTSTMVTTPSQPPVAPETASGSAVSIPKKGRT